jgi:hypothetical protein
MPVDKLEETGMDFLPTDDNWRERNFQDLLKRGESGRKEALPTTKDVE